MMAIEQSIEWKELTNQLPELTQLLDASRAEGFDALSQDAQSVDFDVNIL